MTFIRTVLAIPVFLSACLTVSELAEAGTLEEIEASGEMKLAFRVETPPFSSRSEGAKEPEGFTIDLCRIIAGDIQRMLGIADMKITWVEVGADDRIDAVAEGRAHLECGATTITLSRQEKVDFSNLTYATGASLMRLSSTPINSIYDLGGKKVSVVAGTTTEKVLRDALKQAGINARILVVNDHTEALKMLAEGKTDAMAGDNATLFGIGFKVHGEREMVITEDMLSFEPFALPLRRNDADFRLAVNRSLSNLYVRGDVGRSWEQWFGRHGVKPTQLLLSLYRLNSFAE